MNFNKLWFWLSAVFATAWAIFGGLRITLTFFPGNLPDFLEKLNLGLYPYIIVGVILFPVLLNILVKSAGKKILPNYFLWFFVFSVTTIFLLTPALIELFVILTSGCSSFCGAFALFYGIPGIISLIIAMVIFIKSKRLS